MKMLDAAAAYRLWAPAYSAENAVSAIEDRLVGELTPPLIGKRLLDAGCGTGRRLTATRARTAIGIEPSAEMLAIARATCGPAVELIPGDVGALPVAGASADVTWCRLVLGHLPDCAAAYRELARATAPGGWIIVTDFHPQAHDRGHRRSFRADGEVYEVEHHRRSVEDHLAAARRAGLHANAVRHGAIGEAVLGFYEAAGRMDWFERDAGLNVVLALAFRHAR
jgi:malonyl-CoA O-methyltransferase